MDYRPDFQPSLRDVLTFTENVVPDKAGNYFTSYAAETSGYTLVAALGSVLGARQLKTAAGTARLVVGTGLSLKEADGAGGWTDRSGTTYGLGAADRWWFASFGDEVLAASAAHTIQKSTGGNFADLTAAPKAQVLLIQSGHVLALNYNDGTANPSGIKWCSQYDSSAWTATGANSAGSITLKETPGPIVAGAEIHDIVAIWKARSMYVGRRVGGREIWQFNTLSKEIGCLGLEAWVACPVGIIFAADSGVFLFDGSVPRPIDNGIRRRIYTTLENSVGAKVFMSHDESLGCAFLWIIGTTKYCFAYNYISDKWGVAYRASSGGTLNIGSTVFSGFTMPVRDANYQDASALQVSDAASQFRTAHLAIVSALRMVNLSSITPANTFVSQIGTGHLRAQDAAPDDWTLLDRISPLWASSAAVGTQPSGTVREATTATATVTPYERMSGAGAMATVSASLTADKRFDMKSVANVHTVNLSWTDQYAGIADLAYRMRKCGGR